MVSNSLKPDASDAKAAAPNTTELDRLRRVWETLGRDDPLWAVLSQADKRGGRWDPDEFLATGHIEIEAQLAALAPSGYPSGRELALDFGCGAGRLTRALAAHFEHVIGIDVSASMVDAATRLNADVGGIEFRVNPSPRLDDVADASVDFVFSHITLQHIPAALAAGYVGEFFRVLAPGGAVVFQFVDDNDESLRGRIFGIAPNRWLNPLRRILWRRRDVFEMHTLPESLLRELLRRHPDLRLVGAADDSSAGVGWRGRRWVVVNDAPIATRVACNGYVLYAYADDVQIGAPLVAGAMHDSHVAAVLREYLRQGDVVLDVGANIGSLTVPAAALVGPRGRVMAVEPIARNRVLLARALQASGLRNVQIVAAAADEREGEVDLRTHPSTSNSATPAASGDLLRAPAGETSRIRTVALDTLLDAFERLDLVKIDIEGMEPRAFRGLERAIERFRPLLVSEFHPWAIERATREDPVEYLRQLRRYYPAFEVLHRDGVRERCATPEQVMDVWRRENTAAQMDGRLHLDLLLAPAPRVSGARTPPLQ
jgi:FkbM family methyltransferase